MKDLAIILPVYNEKQTISVVLKEWKKELRNYNLTYYFLICEDGSTDGTKELLSKLKKKYTLEINQKNRRRGYGKAVVDGVRASNSSYILCVDSDGQCSPKDFRLFWRNRDNADILIGWRKIRADATSRKLY